MDKEVLKGLQTMARTHLEQGNVWQSILTQMYLDWDVLNLSVYDEVVSSGATLSRVALGTAYPPTYGEQEFDALYVVETARAAMISSLPETMRELVSSRFPDVSYLRGVPVPEVSQIASEAKAFREGAESHGYRELRQNMSQLYSRSAGVAIKGGHTLNQDILVLALLSDQAAFDAHLIGVSQDHRDWLLNSTMVRKGLYMSLLDPDMEAEDVRAEVIRCREIMVRTLSRLEPVSRQVKWYLSADTLPGAPAKQEEAA